MVPSTALPTPSYPDTIGQSVRPAPDTFATNRGDPVLKQAPIAEKLSNPRQADNKICGP